MGWCISGVDKSGKNIKCISIWVQCSPPMNKPVFMFTYELPLVSFLAPKEKLAEPEGPSDAVAIGAGVGGTIAVLAVIAVVAFVVIKRRGK